MEDGYRKIKQVVIVLVGMAVLNVVLNLLAGQAYIGPVIRLVITLIFGLLLFQANNIVRWLVVISAGLGVIFGVIGYFGLAGQIGYFHWLSLWVLAFAAVNGWIVGVSFCRSMLFLTMEKLKGSPSASASLTQRSSKAASVNLTRSLS